MKPTPPPSPRPSQRVATHWPPLHAPARAIAFPLSPQSSVLSPRRPRGAFTLPELLVVIGIIAVLISILLPTIGRIRTASYEASTRQEIGQIVSACQNYHQDFRAYPGPVSNTDIESVGAPPFSTFNPSIINASQPNINIVASSQSTGTLTPSDIINYIPPYPPPPATPLTTAHYGLLTGAENLVLGLCGGLWRNPVSGVIEFVDGPPTPAVAGVTVPNSLIGTGPQSLLGAGLNPTGSKQYTSYLTLTFPGSNLMLNGDGSSETGITPYYYAGPGASFGDCVVPVFTDQFPDHLPILFLRARVGAHGVISGPITYSNPTKLVIDPTTTATAHYNYDLGEIVAYTWSGWYASPATASISLTTPGLGIKNGKGIVPLGAASGTMPQHGLQGVEGGTDTPVAGPDYLVFNPTAGGHSGNTTSAQLTTDKWDYPVPTNTLDNAAQYFMNASIQPTNITSIPTTDYTNATGTPRGKDEFIIISAGRDRTYGTSDDITSFGDVEP